MMLYIPHIITYALCSLVLVVAGINLAKAVERDNDALKGLLILSIFFQISTIVTFMIVQAGWVLKNHDELVGMSAQLGWLAYDYQNKLFHLFAALLMGHWLKCKMVSDNKQGAN